MSAFNHQVGGTHYKSVAVQPIQLSYAVFGGDTLACKVSKYLTREKDEWGRQVAKAEHILQLYHEVMTTSIQTHIKPLGYAQVMILTMFIEQQPAPVRAPLRHILHYMLQLGIDATDIQSHTCMAPYFGAIRNHYCKD